MSERRLKVPAVVILVLAGFLASCSTTADDGDVVTPVEIPAAKMSYVVLAWSDTGMHWLSATYDKEVFLPPYNTVWAQVIKRGDPPEIVTTGVNLEYRIVGNTYSYGKTGTTPWMFNYAGFWDNSLDFYGVALAPDTGLNLVDPDVHNGLTGTMLLKDNHFEVDGVPVVPINDAGKQDFLQKAEIIVRDASTNEELARTEATVPASDETGCTTCHGRTIPGQSIAIGSVLEEHDEAQGTTFAADGVPVVCADCHGSPALGQTGAGSSGLYLSQAIHGFHSTTAATCYNCHPGATTKANRSIAHTATTENCTNCHYSQAGLASTILAGRVPWQAEPACADCHKFVAEVSTGTTLYHNAQAHNGISCAACHGSAHAQIPSEKDVDNWQAHYYQNKAIALGSCRVCHSNSKGGGLTGIVDAHGGDRATACTVCHTGPIRTNNPYEYPHRFQQRKR